MKVKIGLFNNHNLKRKEKKGNQIKLFSDLIRKTINPECPQYSRHGLYKCLLKTTIVFKYKE